MANEAVTIELLGNLGDPISMTVADGAGIEKGTLLVLSDPRTAAASTATTSGAAFAGIAAGEKVASDGSTTLAVYTNGIFDLTNSSVAVTVGVPVVMSGANTVRAAIAGDLITGAVIGTALETAAANEVFAVRLIN